MPRVFTSALMLLIAPSGGSYNKGTIVRYNISQNDEKDIFEISGEVENAQIYNNTIYVDAGSNAKMLRINTYFITILHRAAGKPDTAQPSDFRDVPETSYYAQAVAWAAKNGIVTGTSNDSFSPDDLLTREQLVTILYRYLLHTGRIMPVTPELSGWSDADIVSTFAREAMTWATSAGIVNGSGNQTLHPKQAASRAQVAALMMRLYQAIRK